MMSGGGRQSLAEAVDSILERIGVRRGQRAGTTLVWLLRYGGAVAGAVFAAGWRWSMDYAVGPGLPHFITWYPVVMVVALIGGFGPGLVSTLASALIVAYWVMPPVDSFAVALPVDRLALGLFIVLGVMVSAVAELYRRARHRAAIIEKEFALRESAEALRASTDRERFLASIIEGASQAFAVAHLDGTIGQINRAFERLTGYTADELRTIDWARELTPPEWQEHEKQKIDELNRTGIPIRYEKEYVRKDGTRVPVDLLVHKIRDPFGDSDIYYSFISDISERRRAQEALKSANTEMALANAALQESRRAALNLMDDALAARHQVERAHLELAEQEERFRSHVENAGLAVVEWDSAFVMTRWAGEAERIFGWSAAEVIGRPIRDLNMIYEADVPVVAGVMQKLTDGVTRRLVTSNRNYTKSGRVIHSTWYNSVRLGDDGRMVSVLSLVQDDTARVEAEESVRELNATLERRVAERTAEVQQLADQLRALAAELTQTEQRERKRLASILHDHIQQLLVAAQMQLGMIKRADARLIPSVVQGVESIITEAIAASRSLTVELSPPILHQAGLVAGLSWLAARMEEKHGFAVHVRSDRSAEPSDENLRVLLFESVRELLLNCVKHSGEREADVVMTQASNRWTKIVVEDKGIGFDPSVIQSRRATGGFGLFSIQQRLAHVGGRLEIESTRGEGARLILLTPLSQAVELAGQDPIAPPLPLEPAALQIRAKGQPVRVLLADDHKILRQGLISLLQFETDIEVVGEAADGKEAVELARQIKPDVIIMDINMPVMDGVEATEIIVSELPSTKVIGLTMHVAPDVATGLLKAGAVGCLTKGGPSEDLISAIRSCCRGGIPPGLTRSGRTPLSDEPVN